jgi:hypothetical protein
MTHPQPPKVKADGKARLGSWIGALGAFFLLGMGPSLFPSAPAPHYHTWCVGKAYGDPASIPTQCFTTRDN